MKSLLALAVLAVSAVPALSEVALWPRDPACKPVVAVQQRQCYLQVYDTCPAPAGTQEELLRIDAFDDTGPLGSSLLTKGLTLVTMGDQAQGYHLERLAPDDPAADFTKVLAGEKQVSVSLFKVVAEGPQTELRSRTEWELLPETFELSGLSFKKLKVSGQDLDEAGQPQGAGMQTTMYYNETIGFPISGEALMEFEGEVLESGTVPAELIFPKDGEAMAEVALLDCGPVIVPLDQGSGDGE